MTDTQAESTGLLSYSREVIAAIVAIVFGILGWRFTSSAGMAAGNAMMTSIILFPILVYAIPKRWKVLFCALPNAVFALHYTFSEGVETKGILLIWGLGLAFGALIGAALMLVERQYRTRGFLAALGVALLIVVLFSFITITVTWA